MAKSNDLATVIARIIMVLTYNSLITKTERDYILGDLSDAEFVQKLKEGGK